MASGANELRISDLQGAVQKESPDVYVTFRLGDEHAETPVIQNAGETLRWSEPISVPATGTGRNTDTLIVRAYDKQSLMPDVLLGEARVNLSEQSLGDSTIAGSGGGSNVQVQLLGKRDAFGGELRFTLTSTEGLSVPGGTTWGPQEVHDGKGSGLAAGALGAGAAGGLAAGHAGDHGTTGFQGGGATAFPAQDSGKLKGEHMSDFNKDTAGEHGTTGFGGGGATARPAEESGRDLKGERLSDFEGGNQQGQQGGGIVGMLKSAVGYGPGDTTTTNRDQPTMVEKLKDTVGLGGPASTTDPNQPTMVDKLKGTVGLGGPASTTSQDQPTVVDRLKGAVGMGGAAASADQGMSTRGEEPMQGRAGFPGEPTSEPMGSTGYDAQAERGSGYTGQPEGTPAYGDEGDTSTGYTGQSEGATGYRTQPDIDTMGGEGETGALRKGPTTGYTAGDTATEQPATGYQTEPRSTGTEGHKGGGITEKLQKAIGYGPGDNIVKDKGGEDTVMAGTAVTEQPGTGYGTEQRGTDAQGEGLADKFKSAVGLGHDQHGTGTGRTGELRSEGYTTPTGGSETRGDVATAPGAAPGAAYTTAGSSANTGAIAAGGGGYGTGATGGHGDDQTEEQRKGALYLAAGAAGITGDGGLDTANAPSSGGPGITTTETATGPSIADQMTPGATATDAGMTPDTGITTSYTSAGDVGTGGMGRSGASGTGYTESGVGGGVATLRKGGIDHQHEGGQHGPTATLRHGAPDPLAVEGQRADVGTGGMDGGGMGAGTAYGVGAGGPTPGTTVSAKDLASDSTKREWAAAENAPLAGDTVSDARLPVPSMASTAGTSAMGQAGTAGDEGTLRISNIHAKIAREEDLLGTITPYLVFEVGRHAESTPTQKTGTRGEELAWDQELQIDVDSAADAELHIIAFDKKKMMLPDSRMGEASARLSQLPRGRPARLNLIHRRTFGNIAGHVDFTLSGGGPGGEGAGNDTGMVEGTRGLAPIEHDKMATRGDGSGHGKEGGVESF